MMEGEQQDVVAFQTLHAMYDERNTSKPDCALSKTNVDKREGEGLPVEQKPKIVDQDTSLTQQLIDISEALKSRVGSDVDIYCDEVRNILLQIAPSHFGTQPFPGEAFEADPSQQNDAQLLNRCDSTTSNGQELFTAGGFGGEEAMQEENFLAEAVHQLMIETLAIEDALRGLGA